MAKIFSPPECIPVPDWDIKKSMDENQAEEEKYLDVLKKYLKRRKPNNDKVGKIIRFPVADGYAIYMIAGLRPVELIHIPLGDSWQYEYANRLTMSDVLEEIQKVD